MENFIFCTVLIACHFEQSVLKHETFTLLDKVTQPIKKQPPELSYKKHVFLKLMQNSQEKACEFGEIFKSNCSEEYLRTAASALYKYIEI